jgi:hypothetical protein
MAFWSWLDVPLAVLVLAAARGIPPWLDRRKPFAAPGLVAMAAADLGPIGFGLDLAGLAESGERLAEPDERLAEQGSAERDCAEQDCLMPQLTPCPQCGRPAEIEDRFFLSSTDGPVEHIALSCIDGHHFRMAADRLLAAPLAPVRGFDAVDADRRSAPMTW